MYGFGFTKKTQKKDYKNTKKSVCLCLCLSCVCRVLCVCLVFFQENQTVQDLYCVHYNKNVKK